MLCLFGKGVCRGLSTQEAVVENAIRLKVIKLETTEQAQSAPTPATIFSLFYKVNFVTTDINACMDSRFNKLSGLVMSNSPSFTHHNWA